MKYIFTAIVSAFFLTSSLSATAAPAHGKDIGSPSRIRVLPPAATISGTTTVCNFAASPSITFTGAGGAGNYTFTYNINGGAPQTITAVGNVATLSVPTSASGVFTYNLTSVTCDGGGCVPTPVVGQSAVVTVTASPVSNANIAGTASACLNGTEPNIVITGSGGTAPYTFTYNINGGPEQTVTTTVGNSVTLTAPTTALGTFVYNLTSVSSTANPCVRAITNKSITIAIVNMPTAAVTGTVTICPYTSTPLTITGTPNGTVVLMGTSVSGTPPPATYTIFLDATGTAIFNTPATNHETVTYEIASVNTNPPGCRNDNVGSQAVVSVAVNGCAKVQAGDSLNIDSSLITSCDANSCLNLAAAYTDIKSTTQYTVSSIDYCPQALFTPVTGPPGSDHGEFQVGDDDIFSPLFSLPFNFCFFGNNYSSVAIGGNGIISFNASDAGNFCDWSYNASLPSNALITNAIFGVYQDTDPRKLPDVDASPAEESINYSIQGAYPCRKLIVNFYHLGQFQCHQAVGLQTYQIVLYEISNIIEVYVENRTPCTGWNGGRGVIGIQNAAGTVAYVPPGRNTGSWSANHEAWRFTPSGPSNASFHWEDSTGATIGTNTAITVCPPADETYTAVVQYNNCGQINEVRHDVTVTVNPDETFAPHDISSCTVFDLTENDAAILGANDPLDFEINYYRDPTDALNGVNAITNPSTYSDPNACGQTIYAGVENFNTGCRNVKSFELHCSDIHDPSPAQTLCLGADPAPMQVLTANTASNSISYVYFTSPQTGTNMYTGGTLLSSVTPVPGASPSDNVAAYDMPVLGSAGSLPNVVGTYYVYAISNPDPGPPCQPAAEIVIDVISLPTAAISAISTTAAVCSGNTATVTFTGTPNTTVTFDADGGPAQTIVLNGSGTATLTTPALTANSTYTLHSVQVNPPTGCSASVSDSATIVVQALPTASISGTATICTGQTATISFSGTPGATVTYNVNGGANQTILLNGAGTASLSTGPLSATTTYNLVSVQDGTALACQQAQTGSATITIGGLPVAAISGDTTICPGQTAVISFTGTPGAIVTYKVDGGANQTIALDAAGNATLTTPALSAQSIYSLVSVSTGGTPACQQNQSGTATVSVTALPTASISGTTTICPGDNATITFNGTANATVSYNVDGGATQTVVLNGSGNGSVTLNGLTATTTVNLEGVQLTPPTGCGQSQSGSVTITVAPLPVASISGDVTICPNSSANVNFTGTPGATVSYNIDGGVTQTIVLSAAGTASVSTGNISATTIFNLLSVQAGTTPNCSQAQSGSVTITVSPLPTAAISGDATICPGDTATITFAGTPGATVSYNIGGGATQTITLDGAGNATLSTGALSSTTTYNLLSVQDSAAPNCSQPQSGSVTITVSPLPVASISGAATICSGASAVVTFMGTANATVSYNIDGGVTQTIVLDASGAGTVSTGNITATRVYNLESVQAGAAPNCSQAQAGSVTITVLPLPVAAISGDTSICSGQSATITFSGTAGATVHYTVNGGAAASITLDGAGSASLSTGALSATSVYALVDATSATTPPCTQGQAGTATVTVLPLPTAAVSGTIAVCQGDPAPEITFTGSGGTPPYVFSYNINGGPTLATPPSTVDTFTITAPTGTVGTFNYNLVSVQDAGGGGCSQAQSATATVTVGAPPVIFAPSQIDVCDDNNDGFAHFDLTPAIAQVTGGNPNLVVSFYETLTDAQTGNSPIGDYTDYTNISPWVQTIYVRAVDATTPGCPAITTLALQVNRVPVPNTTIDDYHLCDVNSPGDNQEAFTLQSWNGHVDADAPPGAVFSYYHSQGAAQGGTGAISDPYTNSVNHEQVWVRIEDGATGCFAVASFYLVVDPLPAVSPATINICGGASGLGETFDLTSVSLDVSGGIPGMSVDYYLAQADALAGNANTIADPQHFVNTANPQTLYAVVRNVATGCFNVTTVTLSVSQGPVLGTPAALVECDDNNDGFATFDLTASYMDIFGSATPPAGITVTIHETLTDAQTGDTPKASPYTNIDPNDQIVYVRATYDATGCYSIVELPLHVNPVPVGSDVDYPVCDDDLDGIGSFDLTTIVDDVLGGLDQSLYSVSFYLTLPQAQAQTPAITNVLNFHNTTPGQQVIYAVVRDNATGCNDIVEVTLTVSPLPGVPVSGAAPYTLCDVNNPGDQQEEFDLSSQIPGILAGQSGVDVSFYLNQADAQVPQSPLPMLYTNLSGSNPQTIWVRLENTTTHCVAYTTLDLRVAPLPVLVPPMDPVVECDPDGDGFAPFDLQALIPDMLQGATGITVTFHETMTDAQGGVGPLANPYTNIVAFDQVVYVRAEDTATGCSSVMALPIKVIPSPQLPPLSPDHDIVMCDQDANNQSGTTVFDLTQNEGYILGLQSGPPSAYTITYYTNQPDAQTGTSGAIVPSTHYTNVANPQTIWVRIEGVGTDCYNVSSFQISVNTPLALTHPTNLNLCDDGPTSAIPQTVFDLRVKQAEILGGASPADYTFTWYGSMSDYLAHSPIGDPSAYTNLANPQTVVAEVTSPEGCRSFTTLTIRVIPLPNPRTANLPYPRYEACDDNLPVGTEAFDLTLNETYIRNNDPDLVFEYYDTLAGAQSGVGAIGDPTNHQTATGMIYIRVVRHLEQDINGRYCAVILSIPVVVHPLPDVQPWADTQCGAGTSLSGTFTLSDYNDNVMVSGDTTGYSFAYFPDLASAQGGTGQLPDAYTTTSNPQVITVRVTDDATGCVNYTSLTLGVMAGAVASAPTGLAQCGIDQYGFMDVDLTQFDTEVLSGQDPASFTVAYFATAGDAAVGTSPLASPFNTTSVTLWAVVTNTATGCRSVAVPVSITIEPLANPVIDNTSNTICVEWGTGALLSGLTLHSNLSSNAGYTLEWFYQGQSVGTGDTYTINDPEGYGDYTVVATSTSALGCVSAPSQVFTVVRSGPAVAAAGTIGYSVSDAFEGNQTITVTVEGYGAGSYYYQLDNGPILNNGGVFTNVPPCSQIQENVCEHQVTIYDYAGIGDEHCDPLVIGNIHSIDYPRFFTPNGDGINDTWNITGLAGDPSAKIYIFDRYGKLLKQIRPDLNPAMGWNGVLNGEPLPSSDYWFVVYYNENGSQKEFKAHFSLKR